MKTTTLLIVLLLLSGALLLTARASSGLPTTSGYTVTTGASFFSGDAGQRSPALPIQYPYGIQGHTEYTIRCTPLGSSPDIPDQIQPVDIAPIWMED